MTAWFSNFGLCSFGLKWEHDFLIGHCHVSQSAGNCSSKELGYVILIL
jgi:hypothetical protein